MNKTTEEIIVALQTEYIKWNGMDYKLGLMNPAQMKRAGIRDAEIVKNILNQNKEKMDELLEDMRNDSDLREMMNEIFGELYEKELQKEKNKV